MRIIQLLMCYFLFSHCYGSLLSNLSEYSKFFVGRNKELKEINENLKEKKILAITGFTGIGKTELARNYASQKIGYEIVGWVDFGKDPIHQLKIFFSHLCSKLNFTQIDLRAFSDDALIKEFFNFLEKSNKNTLLIFDNVDNLDQIKAYLSSVKKTGKIHILLTTQSAFGWDKKINLRPFLYEESLEYLGEKLKNRDKESLRDLSHLFNGYPLALNQAAAYLKDHQSFSIKDYIRLYEGNKKNVWEVEKKFVRSHCSYSPDYQVTVDIAFRLIFDQIKRDSQEAILLLFILAFFNNHHINEDRLKNLFIKYTGKNVLKFYEAIDVLLSRSIIEGVSDSSSSQRYFILHDMVQVLIRDAMKVQEKEDIFVFLAQELEKEFSLHKEDLVNFFALKSEFINDVCSFVKFSKSCALQNSNTLTLKVYLLNYFIYIKRDYNFAQKLIYEIDRDINLEKADPLILAQYYTDRGDVLSLHQVRNPKLFYKVREDLFKALKTLNFYCSQHKEKLRVLYSIAQSYLLKGDPYAAERYLILAKNYLSKVAPANRIHYYYYRSWCSELKGDGGSASRYALEAVELLNKEPDTPIKFYAYIQAAKSYLLLNEREKAYRYAQMSYEKSSKYFGSYKNDVSGESLIVMANINLKNNLLKNAKVFLKLALNAIKNTRPESEDEALCYKIEGDIEVKLNNYRVAAMKYKKSSSIYEKVFENFKNKQIDSLLFSKICLGVLSRNEFLIKKNYFQHTKIFGQDREFSKRVNSFLLDFGLPLFL